MTNRLLTLDAMRGTAAIVVVLHHVGLGWAPSGYLAVDFFFLLSGLVIGSAYQSRLAAGMSFADFAVVRAIRLYPLYALGGVLGLIAQWCGAAQDAVTVPELAAALGFNLVMLPSLAASLYAFPLNPPGWSLFFEMAVNLFYAALLRRLSPRMLLATVLISAVPLAIASWAGHLNEGSSMNAFFLIGAVRTSFSFVLGVTLSRNSGKPLWLQRTSVRRAGGVSLLATVALVLLMFILVWGRKRVLYDLFFIFVAAPVLVWTGARVEPPPVLARVCKALGDLSYPLYAIHFPSMWLFGAAARQVGAPDRVWKAFFCIAIVPVAWGVGRFVEQPVRNMLNGARLPARKLAGTVQVGRSDGPVRSHRVSADRSKKSP